MKKYILLIVSLASFLPNLNYLCQAWRNSRLDSFDIIFYLLGTFAAIFGIKNLEISKRDYLGLAGALFGILLIATKTLHHINALSVLGSVALAWSIILFIGSWQMAYKLLGAYIIFALGIPSSTYYLSKMFMVNVWVGIAIKLLIALIALLVMIYTQRKNFVAKKDSVFFVAACIFTGLLLLHANELYFTGKSFVADFELSYKSFLGRRIEADANSKRFFATSTVEQYRYWNGEMELAVLAVKCGENIHEIHPASHCLRTSRWEIIAENIFLIADNFAVTEIEAVKNSNKMLVWVWYSSDEFSTPAFLGFRRRFRNNGSYYTYQISVPIMDNNVEKSRETLRKFIEELENKKERK